MTKGAAWVRLSEKEDVSTGSWSKGKKMPKTAFPLRPSHAYQLAGTWSWRMVSFSAGGEKYRVLLAHKYEKQEFLAMLGRPPVPGKLSAALLLLYFSGGRDRTMTWDIHRTVRLRC